MSRQVHGPGDVSVGDTVRFQVSNKHRHGHMEGTVTAVHAESLTVEVGGKKRIVRMWREKRGRDFMRTKYREHLIDRLTATDLWFREMPSGFLLRPSSIFQKTEEAAISTAALLAMSTAEATASLAAFIEWLKRRPS